MTLVGTILMTERLVASHLGYILDTSHHMRFSTPSLKGRVGLQVIWMRNLPVEDPEQGGGDSPRAPRHLWIS